MKVLVLCYEYPPIGGGGGRVAQTVAEQLVLRGHQVRVQTAALGWHSRHEQIEGVDVFRTASGRRLPDTCTVLEMALFCATSFFPALRHVRTWKPDVVHAHFAMPSGVVAWALHLLTRTPYVLTAHLGDVPGGVPDQTAHLFRMVGPIAHQVWKCAAETTAVSSFVQELAENAYRRHVTRILNGVSLHEDARTEISQRTDAVRLLFAGRFNPQKNAPLLVDAVACLKDVPWHLTMIGDGPDMPAVRERIVSHGLQNRITLTGWLDTSEVREEMLKADVLCLPSSSEGLPVTAIEALKFGLAIVASDIPGVRDVVINGDNGLVAIPGDVQQFADQLRVLLTNPDRLIASRRASKERVKEFDLERITEQYERVLKSAAAR